MKRYKIIKHICIEGEKDILMLLKRYKIYYIFNPYIREAYRNQIKFYDNKYILIGDKVIINVDNPYYKDNYYYKIKNKQFKGKMIKTIKYKTELLKYIL